MAKRISPSLMCRIGSRLDNGFTFSQFVDVTGETSSTLKTLIDRGLVNKSRSFYTTTSRGRAAMDKACDATHGRRR